VIKAKNDNNMKKQNIMKIDAIVGCSALKLMYRNILRGNNDDDSSWIKLIFIFLDCSQSVLEKRLQQRSGHFMKSSMLESQLKTLERPQGDELQDFVIVNGDLPFEQVLKDIDTKLKDFNTIM
jgi:gluconokinase